jgi:preprotein translocase subunit SecD
MNKRVRARLLVILLITSLSIYLFAGFPPSAARMKDRIHLGLDLQGGILLVLEVVTDDAIKAGTDQTIDTVRAFLQKEHIGFRQVMRGGIARIVAAGVDSARDSDFRLFITERLPDWDAVSRRSDASDYTVALKPNRESALREQSVNEAINVIRNRIDRLGVTEPTIQRQGGAGTYQISVQLPGVGDPDRVKNIIQSTALLEMKLVDGGPFPNKAAAMLRYGGALSPDLDLLPSMERAADSQAFYAVHRVAAITGRDLRDAYSTRDDNGHPAVGFNLKADGAQRFARLTEGNIGKQLAIVLDNKIQSAPTVEMRISDSGIIRGGPEGFAPQQAQDLALTLRSGALPASLKYLQEEKVSATLGAYSIHAGVTSATVALVAVALFMLFYYRLPGVNAIVAMMLNLVILLGAIAYFGVTMTLPGIAAVTLTIGVGIDSNVLIFERIREEIRDGKTMHLAVAASFNRVFITLVDTHLAALISAAFLFLFGTGPIKGFAVTLVIGLVSNMFTAVFVSRTLFDLLER